MKGIHKLGTVATKIVEVIYWASIALVVVGIVMLAITPLIITPEEFNDLMINLDLEGSENGKIDISFVLLGSYLQPLFLFFLFTIII